MGNGPYTKEGFLAGWNTGNEYAYDAILQMQTPSHKFFSLPAAELEKVWRWNASIAATQTVYGESLFVPRIMPLSVNGELRTVVVWGDGIPELIPEVDLLLVMRDELAATSPSGARQKDRCLITQQSVDAILAPFTEDGYAMRVRKPRYNSAPQAVRTFIQSLAPTSAHITSVAMETILDAELVRKFAK